MIAQPPKQRGGGPILKAPPNAATIGENSRSAWEVVRPGRYSGFRPAIDCIDRKHDELAAGDFINSRLQLLLKLTWRPTRPDRGWRRGLEVWIAGSRHGSIMP